MERNEVTRLFNRADGLRDFPGSFFPAIQKAEAAKRQWATEHPAEAQAENDQRAAFIASEKARRDENYRTSFIGHGID